MAAQAFFFHEICVVNIQYVSYPQIISALKICPKYCYPNMPYVPLIRDGIHLCG